MPDHLVGREPELEQLREFLAAEKIARSPARASGVDLVVAAAIAPDT